MHNPQETIVRKFVTNIGLEARLRKQARKKFF